MDPKLRATIIFFGLILITQHLTISIGKILKWWRFKKKVSSLNDRTVQTKVFASPGFKTIKRKYLYMGTYILIGIYVLEFTIILLVNTNIISNDGPGKNVRIYLFWTANILPVLFQFRFITNYFASSKEEESEIPEIEVELEEFPALSNKTKHHDSSSHHHELDNTHSHHNASHDMHHDTHHFPDHDINTDL